MDSSRPVHAIYIPGDAALYPAILIPFKSDVLYALKKGDKIESVNPDAVNISIIH